MVTITWINWPLVTAIGVMLVEVNGPYQGVGFVWGMQLDGLDVSTLDGFTPALKPILAQVFSKVKTDPMVPVWLEVVEPESTMEKGPAKPVPKL